MPSFVGKDGWALADSAMASMRRGEAEAAAVARERIAAGVAALGCRCTRLFSAPASTIVRHHEACPLSIAAAIRSGEIGGKA